MDIVFLLKIAAVGLIVAVLCQVLAKTGREEYAMLTALTGIIVILAMILPYIFDLIESVESIFNL